MGKLKPIKTLQQHPNLNSVSDLTDPKAFDPVLSRISQKSLLMMFENDLTFSLKAIKFNTSSNHQKLLNIDLFLDAWNKYGSYLPPLLYATRLIESGEELLQSKGFHNLANLHCFSKILDGNQIQGIEIEKLMIRAKYGRVMVNYIQILSMDPLIRSPIAIKSVENLLSELIEIVDECNKKEQLAGLMLTGSYHIRNICNHLYENKNYSLTAEYLAKSLNYLKNNIELMGAEFIPWIVDNIKLIYNALLNICQIKQANNMILETITMIKYIEQLEKEAKYSEILPKELQEDIHSALYDMSLLLFGCEVRAQTLIMYTGTIQEPTYHHLSDHGDIGEDTRLSPTCSTTVTKTQMQLKEILKGQIVRLCGKFAYRSLYNITYDSCALSFQENLTYNLKKMTESYVSENNIVVEKVFETIEFEDSGVSEKKEAIVEDPKRRSGRREKQENAEEIKLKKKSFFQLISRLQMFTDDRGKLAAINSALCNLGVDGHSLFTYEKCSEPILENMIKQLINLGFHLLSSSAGSLDGHIPTKKIMECKKGKLNAIQSIPKPANLDRFDLKDLLSFSRYLYVQEYWPYFLRVSMNNNDFASIREFSLRSECINFDISFHSERMVGFEYSQQDITKSLVDLKKRRQKVGKSVEKSLIGFLKELCLCLEDNRSRSEICNLLADSSYILWKFTEPYFVDLDPSSTNFSPCLENIIILAINAAQVISSQICNHSNLAVSISSALAVFLELKGQYNDAIEILLSAIEGIKLLQLRLGENGTPFINSLLEENSIETKHQGKMLTKSLACHHVDLLQGYYRCFIKLNHLKTMEEVTNKEGQYFRLTQKKITISPPFDATDVDRLLKLVCGESYTHRAIFLQVFATTANHYHIDIRKKSIILSYKYLKQSVEYEEYLKRKNMENNINQLSIAYRSHNCIALKLRSNSNRTTVKLFCGKKSVNKMVSITNTKFSGTGEAVLIGANNHEVLLISGLKENTFYEISGTLYDSNDNSSKATDRINIITGNILPLVLCWENFCLIAPSFGYLSLGLNGLKFLWSYFVDAPFQNSIENALPKKPAMLKQANIERENQILLDNFVRVIYHINNEEYLPILGSYLENLKDHSQYHCLIDFRLRAIERLLVAVNICKLTDNRSFELKGAVCCFNHIESFLKTNLETTEFIPILIFLHSSMIKSISSLENSRTQGIIDFVIPITLHLIKLLTKLHMYEQVLKICTEILELVHRFCVLSDPKIKINTEEKYGRSIVSPDSNLKNLYNSQEFLHHEYLAVSNRWKAGYTTKRTQLDQFCEYLDSKIVICCFKLPFSLENSLVSDTLRKELSRRSLDSQPTMKDIQILYQNSQSAEIVFHEVLKFRNHPRFIEIASKIAGWAISTKSFEQASKLCGEIEDWCSKRSLILGTIDLSPEEYQKWEAAIKRKPPIKINKQSEPDIKQEKRGRSRRAGQHAPQAKRNGASKNAGTSTDRESSSSRERKQRSVSPENRPSLARRISYSGNKVLETGLDDSENKNSYIAYRRRKITFKQQYLEGLAPDMKIKMDKAVKVLDRYLSSLWYRFRIRRRLAFVLRFEAYSRIDISLIHAESLFGILKRDLIQKGFVKKETLEADFARINTIKNPKNDELKDDEKIITIPTVLLNTIKDAFQYYTFGINLAARNGSWIQLLSGVQQIHSSYQYLASLRVFDSDIWKDRLSKWFYLIADDICDLFQTVEFVMENSIKAVPPVSLKYMNAPKYNRRFPVESREDIYDYSWNIFYKDGSGLMHAERMDIKLIVNFLHTTLEMMNLSKKSHRLNLLLDRLNHIFYGCQLFLSYRNDIHTRIGNSHTILHYARCLQGQKRIDMYANSFLKAEEEGCLLNEITAMNELGDTLISYKKTKDAGKNWMKCIEVVFKKENILTNWPNLFSWDANVDKILGIYQTSIKILQVTKNVKLSIFMGLIVAKLAYSQHYKSDESKNQIILLAVCCLLAPFNIIPSRPSTYVEFSLWESEYFADILEKFSMIYKYDSHLIMDQILWMINYCNSSQLSYLVFPLNCYIKHITKWANFSSIYTSINRSAEIQALQNLNLSDQAFSVLKNMKNIGDSISSIYPIELETILTKTVTTELLDIDQVESLGGIYSQELIAITKIRFILDFLRTRERTTEQGIQDAKSFILEKMKKLYSQKLQNKGTVKLFYDRAEICWYLLLGDLCVLEKNIGIGIKWYFTAMEGIHTYLANNRSLQTIEYGFMSLPHLRFMILEKTIRGFLSLRYFDVANHMAQTARKEAESIGMKLKAAVFYSLESVSNKSENFGTLPPPAEWLQYIHKHNMEAYSTALELMYDHNNKANHESLSELVSIAKAFPTKKEDILRLSIKQFLIVRLISELDSIQPLFIEIQKLFSSFECSKGLCRNYMLLKVRNLVDLSQLHQQLDPGNLAESKQDLIVFLSKVLQESSFSYGQIREGLLLISSIDVLHNIRPTKWLYLATKSSMVRAHYKLKKTLPFHLKVENIPQTTLYDLDLFNCRSYPSANAQLLPNPLENDVLENVLKYSDILQAIPEMNVSQHHIFEIVCILEEELLNPYQPVTDPWEIACQYRLGQLLSLADSDYKWGLDPSSLEESQIPADFYCIQWLETRQNKTEESPMNQANMYKLYFCASDQTIINSRSLVPKSTLQSLLEKAKALLAALQRSSQVPDSTFIAKITDTWNSILKTFISFFCEDQKLVDLKYLNPNASLVECLIKSLDTSQGYGYGGDLTDLIADPESSKIFFEWLLATIN